MKVYKISEILKVTLTVQEKIISKMNFLKKC